MSVSLGTNEDLAHPAVDRHIDEDLFVDAVVVVLVMWRPLIEPDGLTRVGTTSKDAARPFVVARPLFGIPRTWIRGAVINKVELRVV